MAAIDTLFRTMLEKGGSDLHLTVGLSLPPTLAPQASASSLPP